MVDTAGQRSPDGWMRGEGFVRPSGADAMKVSPRFREIGKDQVQERLGHESITTTIDTYGHLLPAGGELILGSSTRRSRAARPVARRWP